MQNTQDSTDNVCNSLFLPHVGCLMQVYTTFRHVPFFMCPPQSMCPEVVAAAH